MTARDDILAHPGVLATADAEIAGLLDLHRTEVIAKAIGRLRAIPVDCTALTGPVWYGDGWNAAITCLEEIADYQKPDDEAYPGELQKLRALFVGLRAALLRRDDIEWARQQLVSLAEYEAAARAEGKSSREADATPDFFQPSHTYQRGMWRFQCIAVSRHPVTGDLCAHGWEHTEPLNNPHDAVKWPEDWHRWSDAQ